MNGLAALVPLAELLSELAGGRIGATRLAIRILNGGVAAIPRANSDLAVAAQHELTSVGVVTEAGIPVVGRAAELVVVCEVLASSHVPPLPEISDPRLVLTAPTGTVLLRDEERLDGFVLDIIRMATRTLHIGGAFWNDEGFEMLNSVLLPALRVRQIETTLYANEPDVAFRSQFGASLGRLREAGRSREVVCRRAPNDAPREICDPRPRARLSRHSESHVMGNA